MCRIENFANVCSYATYAMTKVSTRLSLTYLLTALLVQSVVDPCLNGNRHQYAQFQYQVG